MLESPFWNEKKSNMLAGYLRGENGQRAFGVTGAHHHKSWDNDDFRTCVLNAIIWTAKMEVPKDGVKSLPNPTSRKSEKKN